MQLIARTRTGDPAVIRLNPLDNVLIARQALPEGLCLEADAVTVRQPIPSGHKVASQRVEQGQPLRRYGQIIGFASQPIEAGDHVHVHNVEMGDFARDYAFGVDTHATPGTEAVFQGIVRADGRVATRNYVGILTSVNCSATVARASGVTSHWFRFTSQNQRLLASQLSAVAMTTFGAKSLASGLLRLTMAPV